MRYRCVKCGWNGANPLIRGLNVVCPTCMELVELVTPQVGTPVATQRVVLDDAARELVKAAMSMSLLLGPWRSAVLVLRNPEADDPADRSWLGTYVADEDREVVIGRLLEAVAQLRGASQPVRELAK